MNGRFRRRPVLDGSEILSIQFSPLGDLEHYTLGSLWSIGHHIRRNHGWGVFIVMSRDFVGPTDEEINKLSPRVSFFLVSFLDLLYDNIHEKASKFNLKDDTDLSLVSPKMFSYTITNRHTYRDDMVESNDISPFMAGYQVYTFEL